MNVATTVARGQIAPRTGRVVKRETRRPVAVKTNSRTPIDLHWGRLSVLMLVLVAGALYVPPLKALFSQQDRHHVAVSQMEITSQTNSELRAEVARLQTDAYISQQAREDFQLVPHNVQAFVVTGLPSTSEGTRRAGEEPSDKSLSLAERMRELWSVLLN